jgi:hypothetical protein
MSTGIDIDVRFDHAAATQAIRVLNSAIADTEALLKRRRERKFTLSGDWEGPAADWYEDRFAAVEVVAAVMLDRLRETIRALAKNQAAASEEQRGKLQAREFRRQAAETDRRRLESQRLENQRKAEATANESRAASSESKIGMAA